ncbi:hypothetical protein pb186bvf_018039 [Paramecium bursaria]
MQCYILNIINILNRKQSNKKFKINQIQQIFIMNTNVQTDRNTQNIKIVNLQSCITAQQPIQFKQEQQNQQSYYPNIDYQKQTNKHQNQEVIKKVENRRLQFPRESGVLFFNNDKIKLVVKKQQNEERKRSRSKEKLNTSLNTSHSQSLPNTQNQFQDISSQKLNIEERDKYMMKILSAFQKAEERRREIMKKIIII